MAFLEGKPYTNLNAIFSVMENKGEYPKTLNRLPKSKTIFLTGIIEWCYCDIMMAFVTLHTSLYI